MPSVDDIPPLAIEQIGLAVVGLIGWTGVHLSMRVPSKWRLRRAGTRLKVLEMLVRRLIILMALELDPVPAKPKPEQGRTSPDLVGEAADGVDHADFPKVCGLGLSLLPSRMEFGKCPDFSQFRCRTTPPIHIAARRFSRRIVALQKVLDAPEAHAKRLARHLFRIRRAGETAPLLGAVSVSSGLPPEIGLLHGGLAMELRDALKGWDSS